MERRKPTPELLKQVIFELQEPIVFKNIINNDSEGDRWDFLGLGKLRSALGDMPLSFRTGKNSRTDEPQWDLKCPLETMTIDEFLQKSENSEDWYYFDYKYMHEWFREKPEILSAVDWRPFGVDKTGEDSTLWVGSKGAHTNCHQDSYGCNLVKQIHGRKLWLLFPPDSGKVLQETRVPYEESTIYSRLNFFCPSISDEESLRKIDKNPMRVVLEAGDVLLVPRGWWHFVESLDLSVSVNVWLPLASDCQARLREALVKLIMERIGEGLPAVKDQVTYSLRDLGKLIEKCVRDCEEVKNEDPEEMIPKKMRKTPWTAEEFSREYEDFVKIGKYLSGEEFRIFLSHQRDRFPEEKQCNNDSTQDCSNFDRNTIKNVADSFCHPDVINKVVEMLLNKK
ncbi:HSPB1-associated protein 1 [Diachasma alloeum]|uniref:HSPB1-associated protein 1 n=1 Tax=Diachasma alloeum TaxID=454923 RepID=UPI0007384E7B|nr:HSPB1-associated protein 1 [Diachasma alloeum]